MQDLISVIIPLFNNEKYISRCLESIINQTYKKLEIIIVDDGSTDNSSVICSEYEKKDDRIKVIHKENGGVSSARNMGLEIAKGDFISFVDSDDWLEIDMYESMLTKLKEEQVDIVRCGFSIDTLEESIGQEFVFSENKKIELKTDRCQVLELYANVKTHADICFLLIKKEFLDKILPFNTRIILGEDLIFAIELMCVIDSIYYYNRNLYHYYANVNSATRSISNVDNKLKSLINLYPEIVAILEKYNVNDVKLNKTFAKLCFNKIYGLLKTAMYTDKKSDVLDIVFNDFNMDKVINKLNNNELSVVKKIFIFLLKKKYKRILFIYCYLIEMILRVKRRMI